MLTWTWITIFPLERHFAFQNHCLIHLRTCLDRNQRKIKIYILKTSRRQWQKYCLHWRSFRDIWRLLALFSLLKWKFVLHCIFIASSLYTISWYNIPNKSNRVVSQDAGGQFTLRAIFSMELFLMTCFPEGRFLGGTFSGRSSFLARSFS